MRTSLPLALQITLLIYFANPAIADSVSFDSRVKADNNVGISSRNKLGDVITLNGNGREISEFIFYYYQGGRLASPTGRIRFYTLDSFTGLPGEAIWDSGSFEIENDNDAGYFEHRLTSLSIKVPTTFTWTIELTQVPASCVGWCTGSNDFFSPLIVGAPIIGRSEDYFIEFNAYTSSWEKSIGIDLSSNSLAATIKTKNKVPLESIFNFLLMADD